MSYTREIWLSHFLKTCISDESSFNEVLKHSSVFLSQIKLADVILLNKTDLIDKQEDLQIIHTFLAEIAPGVRVIPAKYGIVPIHSVLGNFNFDHLVILTEHGRRVTITNIQNDLFHQEKSYENIRMFFGIFEKKS